MYNIHDSGRKLFQREDGTQLTDGDLKFPAWQVPLQEAILEFDRDTLQQRIQQVESLIHDRLQQMTGHDRETNAAKTSDHYLEQMALYDALRILRRLERERLDAAEPS